MRPQTPSVLIVWFWRVAFVGAAATGAALPGCGGSSPSEPKAATATAPPVVSIGAAQPGDSAPQQQSEPAAGTPEAILLEAKQLRMKPFLGVASPEQISDAQLSRNKELVRLATEVIAKTHADPAGARLFDDAAFLLMNARLQLALTGDEQTRQENIDALYEHAAAFFKRQPDSKSAAEAAFTIAKLAHENAREHGTSEWLVEFARQAEVFATKFPREQSRAASLLFSAGWSCEARGLAQPALKCYSLIVENFPEAEEAVVAAGSLRRLRLIGQPVQLGGSTLDGGYVSIDEYTGKSVLVLFWQAANSDVAELMPVIADLQAAYGSELAVIGIPLDEDETEVKSFVNSQPLKWRQIFFADPDRRGWKHTVAEFYGVNSVPAVWLIGPDGRVQSTNLTLDTVRSAVVTSLR